MKIHLPISIGCSAALAFFSVACTRSAPIETSSSNKIDPSHLENLIDKEEKLFFLDVRTPEEVATFERFQVTSTFPLINLSNDWERFRKASLS